MNTLILKKTSLQTIVALLLASLAATTASAGLFTAAAAQLGAIDNPGTIPIGVPAISVTNFSATFANLNPTVDYSYSTDGSTNPTAGITPDYHFLGSGGTTPATSPIWTFAAKTSDYYLYSTIDHVPLPNEALESSLWGSGDGGSTWTLGTVVEVYEQGWDAAGVPDDGATRWSFSSPVNMISVQVGLTQGVSGSPPYSYSDGDFETDAVMQAVPEPATWALLGLGVFGLVGFVRRRRGTVGCALATVAGVAIALSAGAANRAEAANIIINGGFELPANPNTTVGQYNESIVPGWETTAPDDNIELWSNGYGSVFAAEGNQHAELNANYVSTLYQDISAVPASSTVGYSFFHRGRTGVDTLRLTISDLGTDNLAGGSGTASDTVLFSQLFSTGNTAWVQYSSTNIGNTTLGNDMRFAFESVSADGGDQRIGNFLDGVHFGIGVPEPASAVLGLCGALAVGVVGRRRAMHRRARSRCRS